MRAELIGSSHVIVALREEVGRLLQRQAGGRSLPPILIQGETGTGKGLLAGAIHRAGPRRDGPFVSVNCAAIPDTLLEAELFGFERGAFTDARQAKPGLVQTAHRGTLFLDEIGLLPGPLQGKLLTVLEERAVRRLGRTRSEPVDVAILAASSEDLERAARERHFAEALYHRLSVVTLRLPPLRERGADILLLAEHFLARAAADYNVPPKDLTPEARAFLLAYPWPGNVRELNNRMERVTLLAEPGLVTREMLGLPETSPADSREVAPPQDARQLKERVRSEERDSLFEALTAAGGNVARAAARLGVPATTLRYRLRKHRLVAEPPPGESPPDLGERPPEPAAQPVGEAVAASVSSSRTLDARASNGPPYVPADHRCPNCEVANPPLAESCQQCAASLTSPTPTSFAQADQPPAQQHEKPTDGGAISSEYGVAQAERRQLTVMSCGVVGSIALSEQLDPEDLHETMREFQGACAEVTRRFQGHIAQYLSDGLLFYFGYPLAHEDDARRAVRTGIEIVEEIGRLNGRLERERGVRLAVRLGIHTGVVVMGEMGVGDKREQLALGDAPHIAAQLQGLAEADTIVISEATHRLVEGYFACHALGLRALTGPARPLSVYRVLHEGTAQSRLDVAATTGLTPLVGREQEVGLLLERWERAKEGLGEVVLLSGEPGIGKSRLVQVLTARIAAEPHARLEYRCSPYYQNSALYPVIDNLQQALQFKRGDSPQEKLSKLEAALEAYGLSGEEVVPLVAPLLSLPLPARYPPLALTPQRQKQKTLEALLAWLLKDAERQATLSVWDDLQWMDPSTLEFLGLLIAQAPTVRVLILLVFRPDFAPPWANRSNSTHIALSRLTHRQAETMVQKVAGNRALPADVLAQLVAKTDGVPLFVEELTKTVLESRLLQEKNGSSQLTGPLPGLAIPSTLHDSLMARLDRLGGGKQIAQLGATLGKEFSYELIQALAPVDEMTVQRELTRLVDAELLYQRGHPPLARYFFKHALIQDTAYQSLLRTKRQQYHRQIAQVLEDRFRDVGAIHPELVAHHYTEAGLKREAALYWHLAGQRAVARSARAEAIGHVRKGLALLETLSDSPERTQQELALQLTLGAALLMLKGYTAPEVEKIYGRARQLRAHVGDSPQLFSALFGLWLFHTNRAELQTAHELGQECFALAQRLHDPAFLLQAHFVLGATSFHLGQFASALADLEQGIALYDPQRHSAFAALHGVDPRVAYGCYAARTLWFLGYPDQALERSQAALTLARQSSHSYALGYALHLASTLHTYRREVQVVQQLAAAAMALANDQGFERWLGGGLMRRGWALAEQGSPEEGIGQLRQGLATWQAHLGRPHFLALLAEAHSRGGQFEAGLHVLDGALAVAHRNAERHYEAELYRLKGELLLGQDGRAEADVCFRQAIDIARHQQAKSLELRAAMSLSRLRRSQGQRTEAREILSEVHGWFREGFDTLDLREARALLDELA